MTTIETRELIKIQRALQVAIKHHVKRDEMNAALHMNDSVLYSNLTNELRRAENTINNVLANQLSDSPKDSP